MLLLNVSERKASLAVGADCLLPLQIPEQRWLLSPPDHDADLDGVCGQHGSEAGL